MVSAFIHYLLYLLRVHIYISTAYDRFFEWFENTYYRIRNLENRIAHQEEEYNTLRTHYLRTQEESVNRAIETDRVRTQLIEANRWRIEALDTLEDEQREIELLQDYVRVLQAENRQLRQQINQ